MKPLAYILMVFFLINLSCKKQQNEPEPTLLGTWDISSQAVANVYYDGRKTTSTSISREDFIYTRLEIKEDVINFFSSENDFNRLHYQIEESVDKKYIKTINSSYEIKLSGDKLLLMSYTPGGADYYLRNDFTFKKVKQ